MTLFDVSALLARIHCFFIVFELWALSHGALSRVAACVGGAVRDDWLDGVLCTSSVLAVVSMHFRLRRFDWVRASGLSGSRGIKTKGNKIVYTFVRVSFLCLAYTFFVGPGLAANILFVHHTNSYQL